MALANLFLDKGLIAYSQGQKISPPGLSGVRLQGRYQTAVGGADQSLDGGSG